MHTTPFAISPSNNSTTLQPAILKNLGDRRDKTIMTCLRDRTPSYSANRYAMREPMKYENKSSRSQAGTTTDHRPEAVPLSKELRTRKNNKWKLLKSATTHDLKHFQTEALITATNLSPTPSLLTAASSSTTPSSSLSSSSCSSVSGLPLTSKLTKINSSMESHNISALEQRVLQLEREMGVQRAYTHSLEMKIIELNQRFIIWQETLNQQVQETVTDQNPEKLKKNVSVRKKQTNATPAVAVQPSKFVAWMKLSNLWKHRPSIETLKQQNIYNDEACFDTEIEMVLKHEVYKTVPKIVIDCCDLIEEKYRKSSEPIEGIYRQCGDYNKIQSLRFKIDANDYDALRQPKIDIHTLTGVLKLFLREIKNPLIKTNEAKTFIGKPNQWHFPAKIEILKRLIRSLPEINRDTMQYLFTHFNRLTKVPLQSVSADTLSVSVTPPIFHTVQQDVHIQDIHVILKECEVLADCVRIMIEYHTRIFKCAVERRQRVLQMRHLRRTLSHTDPVFQNLF